MKKETLKYCDNIVKYIIRKYHSGNSRIILNGEFKKIPSNIHLTLFLLRYDDMVALVNKDNGTIIVRGKKGDDGWLHNPCSRYMSYIGDQASLLLFK